MNPLIPKIEARIRELVPELQELTFGCEVLNEVGIKERVISAMEKYMHGDKHIITDGTAISLCEKDITILGHPIQLHHVLQAINKENKNPKCSVLNNGKFLVTTSGAFDFYWNLSKSFADQEEETKLFVGELLGVK